MRGIVGITFLVLTGFNLWSQNLKPYNRAVIWNGFKHRWTYNHRCNRLGDYVQFNNGNPETIHTSATKLGQDSTYYDSYYTLVSSPNAVFKEGKMTIQLQGKEKQMLDKTVTVVVDADDWLKNKENYITLLNGFDLQSEKGSDKIQLFRITIENGEYSKETSKISFRIKVSVVLDCQSAECPEFYNKVNYELSVYYLLIGADESEMRSTSQFFTKSYSWDKKEELAELPEEKIIDGLDGGKYKDAVAGMKSFSFVLNQAQWLVQMDDRVLPVEYYPKSGDMVVSLDLFFKEWEEGMKGADSAPHKSHFSVKKKGWAMLDSEVMLLQFQQADIKPGNYSGAMYWRWREDKVLQGSGVTVHDIQ